MMADEQTLAVYDARVDDYIKMTRRSEIDPDLVRFMKHLPNGAKVLDLGCGPATSSVILRENGFLPDPVDASSKMVRMANERHDIGARIATFDQIDEVQVFDGVWANFSLLHARRGEMPGYLAAIHKALKQGGIFHIGMKTGKGEERDDIGRFYTYYTQDELNILLEAAGFTILDFTIGSGGGLSGKIEPWVTILAKSENGSHRN